MNMMRRDTLAQNAPRTAPRPGQRPGPQPGQRPTAGARPVSAAAKADELFMVVRQLTELLTKENNALKKHRIEEVHALTERKESLARLYQGHMNAVHRDKNVLASLEPVKRNAITQAAMKLSDLMQENASLLKANIESINLFFKAVTDALKQRHDERSAAYSRNGELGNYTVTKRSLAVSYNQTL